MSSIFWKHFQLCFSKFICLPTCLPTAAATLHKPPFSAHDGDDDFITAAATLHRPPFSAHDGDDDFITAAASSTSLLVKNFNTLYDSSLSTSKSLTVTSSAAATDLFSSSSSAVSDEEKYDLPDFATVFASHRFFFSSPGRSNSIIDSPDPKTTPPPPPAMAPLNGGVAVKKYSPDPYLDFRQSMQEMIEARELTDVRSNGEFLHELLFCYLSLNPKHAHKFIISAFTDLMITLWSPPDDDSYRRPVCHRR